MKWSSVVAACLVLSACSGSETGTESLPQPIEQQTFLGLEIGGRNEIVECTKYSEDGDYKVPSLQEVTPCLTHHSSTVVAVDGVAIAAKPDEPEQVGVLFKTAQVPAGMRTTARGTVQAGLLAQITISTDDNVSSDEMDEVLRMLVEKYGPPAGRERSGTVVWRLPGMTVISYPSDRGYPAEITAASNSYLRWQRLRHEQDSAKSF